MTSKTTNKFSPEVRTRAVRMVLEHEGEHASRWVAVVSISSKIGCTPQTLHEGRDRQRQTIRRCAFQWVTLPAPLMHCSI
jgi:transposase-like protein